MFRRVFSVLALAFMTSTVTACDSGGGIMGPTVENSYTMTIWSASAEVLLGGEGGMTVSICAPPGITPELTVVSSTPSVISIVSEVEPFRQKNVCSDGRTNWTATATVSARSTGKSTVTVRLNSSKYIVGGQEVSTMMYVTTSNQKG